MGAANKQHRNDYLHVLNARSLDGQIFNRGLVIRCSCCGITDARPVPRQSNTCDQSFADRIFRNKGWEVGRSRKEDVCPECVKQRQEARQSMRKAKELVIMPAQIIPINKKTEESQMQTNKAISAEPRQMTRDDRRLIFGKIDEVYVDANEGYGKGWTDQKVATDLGIPVAWVRTIREENFGPEGLNPDLRAAIEDAKKLFMSMQATHDAFRKTMSDYSERMSKLQMQQQALEAKITQLQKGLR